MLRDKCLSSLPQWIIYQPWHVLMSLVLQHCRPPFLVHCVSLPLPSCPPYLKISKYCPHQSLEFSWQRESGGRKGWLGSRIIIRIPRSKKQEDNGLFVRREQSGGKGGWGARWDIRLKLFSEGWWCVVVAHAVGAAFLAKERKASVLAGPLHDWFRGCL